MRFMSFVQDSWLMGSLSNHVSEDLDLYGKRHGNFIRSTRFSE